MKILILTCATGEGHNSAARAVAERLEAAGAECKIRDPLDFKGADCAKKTAKSYNGIIKHAPCLFGLTYLAGVIYDGLRLPSPVYRSISACAEKLYKYIKEEKFERIVCTHLFAMMAVTAVKRKPGLYAPAYGIITDYTAIPFYRETELDGYFVPTAEVKEQLVRKKLPAEKIYVTGIPVRGEFSRFADAPVTKTELGLDENKKTVAVLSGGAGCGKIIKLCAKLEKSAESCEIVVFPGKNIKLEQKLNGRFKDNKKIKIIGFTPEICKYLKCADVILSKAGGLSSTETAVLNAPLVHLKSIPGCETANRKYFEKNGLSVYAPSLKKAVRAARGLLQNEAQAQAMRENQRKIISRTSAEDIVNIVIR